MNIFEELQEEIKSTLGLNRQFPNGFYYVKCPICGEGDAGFLFESGVIVFKCFKAKCGYSTVLKEEENASKKFITLLNSVGITLPPELIFGQHNTQPIEENLNKSLYEKIEYKDVPIPDYFEKVTKKDYKIVKYLDKRRVSLLDLPHDLYSSSYGKWKNRVIFPLPFRHINIGFQGRSIDNSDPKYVTDSFKLNKSVFYTSNGKINDKNFIVEGIFDSLGIVNSIAMLGSNMSKGLAYLIKDRENIIIPDKGTSSMSLKDMEKYDYKISIPNFEKCKDVNDAVKKYGNITTTKKIIDGIVGDCYEAEIKLKLWELDK